MPTAQFGLCWGGASAGENPSCGGGCVPCAVMDRLIPNASSSRPAAQFATASLQEDRRGPRERSVEPHFDVCTLTDGEQVRDVVSPSAGARRDFRLDCNP